MPPLFALAMLFVIGDHHSGEARGPVNPSPVRRAESHEVVFVRQNESIRVVAGTEKDSTGVRRCWYQLSPILRSYMNAAGGVATRLRIAYRWRYQSSDDTLRLSNPDCGTFYYCYRVLPGGGEEADSILLTQSPVECLSHAVEVVVRRDDTYLGFLTELLHTPFILGPRRVPPASVNQTDLRLGADCAALAVYGKRRQGFDYRYRGPEGIRRYLREIRADSLTEGCVIHFGFQVSVLYKDMGKRGSLDPGDLLIQASERGCEIVEYRNSGFFGLRFRPHIWKDEMLRRPSNSELNGSNLGLHADPAGEKFGQLRKAG